MHQNNGKRKVFSVSQDQPEDKETHKQAADTCRQGVTEHLKRGSTAFLDVSEF